MTFYTKHDTDSFIDSYVGMKINIGGLTIDRGWNIIGHSTNYNYQTSETDSIFWEHGVELLKGYVGFGNTFMQKSDALINMYTGSFDGTTIVSAIITNGLSSFCPPLVSSLVSKLISEF